MEKHVSLLALSIIEERKRKAFGKRGHYRINPETALMRRKVKTLLADGYTRTEIALELVISYYSVKRAIASEEK